MRIFITGASGFVGANIARRLFKDGHEVHVSIRGTTNLWRLNEIKAELNIHEMDLTSFHDVSRAITAISPDAIIHMATYGAYPTVQMDFQRILDTNLLGTMNLVRACDGIRYECFINTSSSSEYGDSSGKMNENDFPKPINYYGMTKAASTIFCQTHTRITGAPIITTRLFSVYGPYEEPIRLVPSTIKKCLLGERLDFTAGTQKRDFIYTRDVEDAYLGLLRRTDLKGEVLNIGTGRQYSVREMATAIIRETKTAQKPNWAALPTRSVETFNWVADMRKTHGLLKWKARLSMEEGVKENVAWMRDHLDLYKK